MITIIFLGKTQKKIFAINTYISILEYIRPVTTEFLILKLRNKVGLDQ